MSMPAALLSTVSLRVVMTWVYLATGGSIPYAALFHGTLNAVSSFVVAGISPRYFNLIYPAGLAAAAAVVVAVTRGRLSIRPASGRASPKPTAEA